MPEIAKKIVVVQDPDAEVVEDGKITVPAYRFEIDGVEFPWYITTAGIQVEAASRNQMPGVTITILADRVEFVHALPGVPE